MAITVQALIIIKRQDPNKMDIKMSQRQQDSTYTEMVLQNHFSRLQAAKSPIHPQNITKNNAAFPKYYNYKFSSMIVLHLIQG